MPPEDHPPIDWSGWDRDGAGDVRSPCPMLNALANHHILPHDGKDITKDKAVEALTQSINLDSKIATGLALWAIKANSEKSNDSFDLDDLHRPRFIEHDASLSRNDDNLGDNHTFDPQIWSEVIKTYGDSTETDFHLASKARWNRVMACKKAHEEEKKDFLYGIKDLLLSYGETALFLGHLGDPENGVVPLQYVKILLKKNGCHITKGGGKATDPSPQQISIIWSTS